MQGLVNIRLLPMTVDQPSTYCGSSATCQPIDSVDEEAAFCKRFNAAKHEARFRKQR
jgi:hypothetical protein